ncbi:SHOCT domain-containing protein [Candidatus Enterococcus ferrettii]|uniref:SHOCT domain-containing protein n=1 Tax=Candidatus Enterococcus ferrettii TaxID=2815324 RepID=A0ABV0ER70_9ENTE|nr:SHOCT domain-containing protein [Enterococcus sp. 665A]MBO1340895.1 SHOCT domain-containing protein [Enterococcus sp. 665A]
MAKICAICNKPIGALGVKYTTSDDHKVCWKCIREAGYGVNASFLDIKKETLDYVKNHKETKALKKQEAQELVSSFVATRTIANAIDIDETKGNFRLKGFMNMANVYSLTSVNGYELVENGNSITSGGLGRAAVGAVAFGGVGAIVGAVTGRKKENKIVKELTVKLNISDLDNPVLYIKLIDKPIKSSSKNYQQAIQRADQIIASLDALVPKNSNGANEAALNISAPSAADEIRKFKELLDEGIITEEDFETKKKELMNL